MSAPELAQRVAEALEKEDYNFVCLNFANPDMVGHTGVFEAAVRAIEAIDACAKVVVEAAIANGYSVNIIADHGNSDKMRNPDGSPHTAHTTALVPHLIIKDGFTVRGLTTAASIWITAAIGILIGIGFYFPAGVAIVLTLGTLSTFRWIENRMPAQFYAHFMVRFQRNGGMPEPELRRVVAEHGFSIANLTYRLTGEGKHFEYRMVVRTLDPDNLRALAETLNGLHSVLEYRIAPTGD